MVRLLRCQYFSCMAKIGRKLPFTFSPLAPTRAPTLAMLGNDWTAILVATASILHGCDGQWRCNAWWKRVRVAVSMAFPKKQETENMTSRLQRSQSWNGVEESYRTFLAGVMSKRLSNDRRVVKFKERLFDNEYASASKSKFILVRSMIDRICDILRKSVRIRSTDSPNIAHTFLVRVKT